MNSWKKGIPWAFLAPPKIPILSSVRRPGGLNGLPTRPTFNLRRYRQHRSCSSHARIRSLLTGCFCFGSQFEISGYSARNCLSLAVVVTRGGKLPTLWKNKRNRKITVLGVMSVRNRPVKSASSLRPTCRPTAFSFSCNNVFGTVFFSRSSAP